MIKNAALSLVTWELERIDEHWDVVEWSVDRPMGRARKRLQLLILDMREMLKEEEADE